MTPNPKFAALVLLVSPLACGPAPASPGTDTEAADTEAADTEAADTEAADTEAVDTEAADTEAADTEAADTGESAAQTRALYPTDEGLVARVFVDGELSEAEFIVPGQWTNLSVDGDKFSANAVDGPGFLFGDGASTSPSAVEVDCPVDSGCWPAIAGDSWLLSGQVLSQDASSEHHLVDGDGLTLLYTSEPLGYVGLHSDYLIARESTAAGARLVRVPLVSGAQPEVLVDFDPSFSAWGSDIVQLRPPSDIIWYESLGFVDIAADEPAFVETPLLPGRTLHGLWTSAGRPNHDGILVAQSDAEYNADVAWIPLSDGSVGEAVLISTGALEGKVAVNPSSNPIVVSPAQGWIALNTKLSPESSTGEHLVRWDGATFGEPIPLGEGTSVVHFSPDDEEVFYWTFGEDLMSLARASLVRGVLGVPQVLFEFENARNSTLAEGGSTIAVVAEEGESEELWVLDLSEPGGVPRHVPECGAVNIFATVSADGSLVSCSSGEDFTQGRTHSIVDVRGENVTALVGATGLARFVTIDAP